MNRLKINSIIFAVIFIYGVSSVYSFFLVKEWFPFHTTLQIEGPDIDGVTGKPIQNAEIKCIWYKQKMFDVGGTCAEQVVFSDENGKYLISPKTTFHFPIILGSWFSRQTVKVSHPLFEQGYLIQYYNKGHYQQVGGFIDPYYLCRKSGWIYFNSKMFQDGDLRSQKSVAIKPEDGKIKVDFNLKSYEDIYRKKPWEFILESGGWRDVISAYQEIFEKIDEYHKKYVNYANLNFSPYINGIDRIYKNIEKYDDIEKLWIRFQQERKGILNKYPNEQFSVIKMGDIKKERFVELYSRENLLKRINQEKDTREYLKNVNN